MSRNRPSVFSIVLALVAFSLALRRSSGPRRDILERLGPGRPTGVQPAEATAAVALGRQAESPAALPRRGWWAIAKRTAQKFGENELMSEAASVTFYALLSLVPALTATVSLYGLVADPSTIAKQLDALAGIVPSGGMEIIGEQVRRLTETPRSGLSLGVVIGLATALWSANAATKAMFSALNDVYGERESRSFLRLTAWSLAFTVGGIVTMILGLVLVVALPAVFKAIGLDTALTLAVRILRIPVMGVVIVAALAVLFRYGPSRELAKWRWVTWGSVFGALAWVALSVGFSWYVASFGAYNKTYGSLGAIIGFMTWIWLSTTVLLLGAQLNAEMETQTARDTTTGRPRQLGRRGAMAADTVS